MGLRVGSVIRDFFYFGEGQYRSQGLTAFWYKLGYKKKDLYPQLIL